ncbi:MAG: transketolase [Actinomycetota bacterium]|nr:transketolase [Actinomycetota bacterium]
MHDNHQLWNDLAAQIAVDSIRCTTAAGSGHPTSSMSCAHLMAVLYAEHLRTDLDDPRSIANDRFVMSKGHASPALYSTLKAIGAIDDATLLSLRKMGSPLQGHPAPVPELPWIDVASGSLGQGLAIGLGMAFAIRLEGAPSRVWVMLGDSEMAEGSVWEAMEEASFHEVDNLVAILDLNRLGQRGPTMHGWRADVFAQRAMAFGWHALEIDGHDVVAIDAAFAEAAATDKPTLVIARTEKGHGVSFLANKDGWHGKAVPAEREGEAIEELGGIRSITVQPPKPDPFLPGVVRVVHATAAPEYPEGIATRKAFGETLAWLAGHRPDLVVLDGEVGNSTHTEDFDAVAPERFFQMFIAEQSMIGVQTGLQALGKTAFASSFGAFLSRAMDQLRMGAISRASLRVNGSHAGISIGEDGPSQMALEDLAAFRALHGSTVLYPADGHSTVKLVTAMCDLPGISYVRTTREKTPTLYPADDEFPIGGSKTLRSSADDRATIVGAGITVHEALAAADMLEADGPTVRVIDAYSVKPIDAATLRTALEETGLLVVVEDHRAEGGLGDSVLDALAATGPISGRVVKLAVNEMPGSGSPEELRAWAGIDAASIATAVRAST